MKSNLWLSPFIIWFYRNQVVFNAGKFIPSIVATKDMEIVQEFNGANLGLKWRKKVVTLGDIPNNLKGHTMIHIDACCFNDGTMAMGCVLSDSSGDIILSASKEGYLY